MDQEPEIIGVEQPTYYYETPRRSATGGTWGYIFAVCFCCICLFLLLLGGVGFLLFAANNNNPTPTPTPVPTPTPAPTQCAGFIDLVEDQQPQNGGTCFNTATGTCETAGVCTCTTFQAGSTLAVPLIAPIEVIASVCNVANPDQLCECTGNTVPPLCERVLEGNGATVSFECQQPQACAFLGDVPAADQPIVEDCALGNQAAGICTQVGPDVQCIARAFVAGQEEGDEQVQFSCQTPDDDPCVAVGEQCTCFATFCVRDLNDGTAQFLCQDANEVGTPTE